MYRIGTKSEATSRGQVHEASHQHNFIYHLQELEKRVQTSQKFCLKAHDAFISHKLSFREDVRNRAIDGLMKTISRNKRM